MHLLRLSRLFCSDDAGFYTRTVIAKHSRAFCFQLYDMSNEMGPILPFLARAGAQSRDHPLT